MCASVPAHTWLWQRAAAQHYGSWYSVLLPGENQTHVASQTAQTSLFQLSKMSQKHLRARCPKSISVPDVPKASACLMSQTLHLGHGAATWMSQKRFRGLRKVRICPESNFGML